MKSGRPASTNPGQLWSDRRAGIRLIRPGRDLPPYGRQRHAGWINGVEYTGRTCSSRRRRTNNWSCRSRTDSGASTLLHRRRGVRNSASPAEQCRMAAARWGHPSWPRTNRRQCNVSGHPPYSPHAEHVRRSGRARHGRNVIESSRWPAANNAHVERVPPGFGKRRSNSAALPATPLWLRGRRCAAGASRGQGWDRSSRSLCHRPERRAEQHGGSSAAAFAREVIWAR